MGFLDKKNNNIRIVCAGICVIITVLFSGCSEEGSNINISESVEKYLAEQWGIDEPISEGALPEVYGKRRTVNEMVCTKKSVKFRQRFGNRI